MTIAQYAPLAVNPQLIRALWYFDPFDLFTQQRLIDTYGISPEEVQRAIRLKHIEQAHSATINGQAAYRKGENWTQ